MSERYSRLFVLPNDLYATGSPVVIAAGALLKDNQTGNVLAQLKLRSISPKQIKAVKVCITSMDTVGRTLGEAVEHQYLDLNISRDAEFGQKAAITLPNSSTRSFSTTIEEVAFADNTIWTSSNASWQPLPRPTQLASEIQDGELVKQYQLTYGKQCQFSPLSHDDLWFCSCGAVNHAEERACHSCHLEYASFLSVQWDALKEATAVRLAEEKAYAKKQADEQAKRDALRREEEARQAEIATAKAKKRNKVVAVCAVLAVFVCASAYVVTQILLPAQAQKKAYEQAQGLLEAGSYQEAIDAFTALGEYKDSAEMVIKASEALLESQYQQAVAALLSEDYESAIAQFQMLGSYKDSAAQASAATVLMMDANKKAVQQMISTANIGDIIILGTCEQDENTDNGTESIEWIVLDKNDSGIYVISRYCLFQSEEPYWPALERLLASLAAKWFFDYERSFFDSNLSLPTEEEVLQYIPVKDDRRAEPTAAAQYKSEHLAQRYMPWKIITKNDSYIISVNSDGTVVESHLAVGIRPAMWLSCRKG